MARTSLQSPPCSPWALARRQHGVVTRAQLLELGFSREGIQHRIERGRLHKLDRGIYAVGRPVVEQRGRLMAAVLSCGPEALLGYRSAAAHWRLVDRGPEVIEVVVPGHLSRRRPGLQVHRRSCLRPADRRIHELIPVTSPAATLIDLATQLEDERVEAAVNAADRLDLIDPESLRAEVELTPPRPGVSRLLRLLDRHVFTRTDSALERRFLALVRSARLPKPQTQAWVTGFRVDFYWERIGLVVETDGIRYHRTPTQQARDLKREQAHIAAGLTALRFPAAQVFGEPSRVLSTLRQVIARLESSKD